MGRISKKPAGPGKKKLGPGFVVRKWGEGAAVAKGGKRSKSLGTYCPAGFRIPLSQTKGEGKDEKDLVLILIQRQRRENK